MLTVENAYDNFVNQFNDQGGTNIKEVILIRDELKYQIDLLRKLAHSLIDSIYVNYYDFELEDWLLQRLISFREEYKSYFDETSPLTTIKNRDSYLDRLKRLYLSTFPNI